MIGVLAVLYTVALLACQAAALDSGALGTLEYTLSMIGAQQSECTLGEAAADAVRAVTGTDVVILPGGILYQNLAGGTVTEESLEESFTEDPEIALAQISPAQLKAMLEVGLGQIVITTGDIVDEGSSDFEGFPQISGFTIKCDYSAAPGDRVLSITLEDGTALDLEDETVTLTLASTSELLSGGYGYPVLEAESTEETLLSCFAEQLASGAVETPEGERMDIIGIQGNILMQNVSPTILIIIVVLMLAGGAVTSGVRKTGDKKRSKIL